MRIKIGDKVTLKKYEDLSKVVSKANENEKDEYDVFVGCELTVAHIDKNILGCKYSFEEEPKLVNYDLNDLLMFAITKDKYKYSFTDEFIDTVNGVKYNAYDYNITLKDTAEMMTSSDYKERFKAEYYQLAIRFKKLKNMCEKWDNGTLDFTPTCPRKIYDGQLFAMETYLTVLEERAKIENINLEEGE